MASHPDHASHTHSNSVGLAELLDLDAEVSDGHLSAVMDWLRERSPHNPLRILDLGAGTGTGTIALAERFPHSEVYAADISADMLSRVRDRAVAAGMADRIHTLEVDLDTSWPQLGPIDVIWASASLHEIAHPENIFQNALAALAPGGVIGIVEMDTPPTFLPDDLGLGTPGLEGRIYAALSGLPHAWNHPDWSHDLAATGFEEIEKHAFAIDVPARNLKRVGHYAESYLRRLRPVLEGKLSAGDITVLDALLSPDGSHSLNHRDDLHLRGIRTAWTGLRPAGTAPRIGDAI